MASLQQMESEQLPTMTVMEMATLRNKTALVTGASRGIGRATAAALAAAGAHVLVHCGRSSQEAESLVDSIRPKGGRAEAIRADLATTDGAIWMAQYRWQEKFARSAASDWTCLCATRGSARVRRSEIIRSRTSTISSQRTCEARFLLTPRPREQSRRSSRTSLRFSGLVEFVSMLLRQE